MTEMSLYDDRQMTYSLYIWRPNFFLQQFFSCRGVKNTGKHGECTSSQNKTNTYTNGQLTSRTMRLMVITEVSTYFCN